MNYEVLAELLLSHKGAVEDYPFGPQTAVFKVAGKMFALVALDEAPLQLTLKCDPVEADFFRSIFAAIRRQPGHRPDVAERPGRPDPQGRGVDAAGGGEA